MRLQKLLLRVLLASAAFLVLVFAGTLVALDWYLGSETLKGHVSSVIAERTGLDVRFEGDLGVSIFPWIGLKTGPVRVINPSAAGDDELVRAKSVSAKVSFRQLLSREIDFDIVSLTGLDMRLVVNADGTTNLDPLFRMTEEPSGPDSVTWEGFDISTLTVRGLRLNQASIRYVDLANGLEIDAKNLHFRTGEYRQDEPVEFSLDVDLTEPGRKLEATVGMLGELEFSPDFSWVRVADSSLQVSLGGQAFSSGEQRSHLTAVAAFDSKAQSASLQGFKFKLPHILLMGSISGEELFDNPHVSGHLSAAQFTVRDVLNHFAGNMIPDKDPGIFSDGSFSLDFTLTENDFSISNLDAICDQTRLQGSFAATDFNNPVYSFDITGNRLDFDRYYQIFIVDEPFVLADFGPNFLSQVRSQGKVLLQEVTLGGENFAGFTLAVQSGDGNCGFTLERAGLWGGAATGGGKIEIRRNEDGGFPLALSGSLTVQDVDAGKVPLLSGKGQGFKGQGGVGYSFSMDETVFQAQSIIDEVLRYTSAQLEYNLEKGGLTLRGESEEPQSIPFDTARATAKFSATGKNNQDGSFEYKVGLSFDVASAKEPYGVAGRLNGSVRVPQNLSSARMFSAQSGLQLSGSWLPPGETMLVISADLDLDTASQTIHAKEFTLEGKAGTLVGDFKGYRIFEKDFTYVGPLSFTSDPRRMFGLVDVEIEETRDEDALRSFNGKLDLAFTASQAVLSNLDLVFDDTHATGILRIEDFDTGYSTFELEADELDINRYRPPRPERIPGLCAEPKMPSVPLPLITLSSANIDGNISVGTFRIFDIAFKGLKAHVNMNDGRITLPNLYSDFYGGQMNGTFSGMATKKELNCEMRLRAEDFRGAPFMIDVSGKEYVDGTSTVFFDIHTKGATDDEFIANMSGRAGVTILDGSYRFSGESNPLKGSRATDLIKDNRTGFYEAAALFRVDRGRFMTDDFSMEATYMSAVGAGNFDLDKDTIDFSLEVEYVAVPTVIPVHIIDCLHDPGVSIPGLEILGNTVKEIIGLPLKPFQFLRDLFF